MLQRQGLEVLWNRQLRGGLVSADLREVAGKFGADHVSVADKRVREKFELEILSWVGTEGKARTSHQSP